MPNEIKGINSNRTNQQNLFEPKKLKTINGTFKDGDTSPEQCNSKKINPKEAKKIFNNIDSDGNCELSWSEICDNRDRECKSLRRFNKFMYLVTIFNKGSKKNFIKNEKQIDKYQIETAVYRAMHDGTLEEKLSNLRRKDVKPEEEIQKLKQKIETKKSNSPKYELPTYEPFKKTSFPIEVYPKIKLTGEQKEQIKKHEVKPCTKTDEEKKQMIKQMVKDGKI